MSHLTRLLAKGCLVDFLLLALLAWGTQQVASV
jgi:hypothetical protein